MRNKILGAVRGALDCLVLGHQHVNLARLRALERHEVPLAVVEPHEAMRDAGRGSLGDPVTAMRFVPGDAEFDYARESYGLALFLAPSGAKLAPKLIALRFVRCGVRNWFSQ